NVLAEMRQLRLDIQMAAMTIQRVQIAMFRLQVESAQLDRVKERVLQAKQQCDMLQQRRNHQTLQLERASHPPRSGDSSFDANQANATLQYFKNELAEIAAEEPKCQAELAEAESQFRQQEAKTTAIQDQLDRLDQYLAGAKR
ncbi:MAG: hypothetical protein ABL995_06330, partial [Bryobacteraceae bacterium]